jgi:hypothetical protein
MTNPSVWMALSLEGCARCHSPGVYLKDRAKVETPCPCTDRGVFRAVLAAYKHYSISIGLSIRTNLSQFSTQHSRQGRRADGRRVEEWCADVWLTSKRNLTPHQWQILRRHHIRGEDWTRFGISKGQLFHEKYCLEQKLGRVFRELQPFALYPIQEYFSDSTRSLGADVRPFIPAPRRVNGVPLCPPLAAPSVVVSSEPELAIPVPPKAVLVMPVPAAPEEQPSIEWRIRHWLKDGLSLRAIAKRLDTAGISTPNGSPKWLDSHVKKILLARRAA